MTAFSRCFKLLPVAAVSFAATVKAASSGALCTPEWTTTDVKYSLAQYFDHTALKVSLHDAKCGL